MGLKGQKPLLPQLAAAPREDAPRAKSFPQLNFFGTDRARMRPIRTTSKLDCSQARGAGKVLRIGRQESPTGRRDGTPQLRTGQPQE